MVHRDDLAAFTHAELAVPSRQDLGPVPDGSVTVSAVVEISATASEASRISNSIIAMLNCKDPSWGPTRFDFLMDEGASKARFVLYGGIPFIRTMLDSLAVFIEKDNV
jgi:hypothetical protein